MGIAVSEFGRFWGTPVQSVLLTNRNGMEVEVLSYGCIVRRLIVPSQHGPADVVLGFDTLADYLYGHPYFGAIAGRVANRITNGTFSLYGQLQRVSINEKETGQHLHGGVRGFDKHVWDAETASGVARVTLHRVSADGEEGYPGELHVEHSIELDDDNGLTFHFKSTAGSKDTVVNLANHCYYNLSGHQAGPANLHRLCIHAAAVTPTDSRLIPTGEILPVTGTVYDFTSLTDLNERTKAASDGLFDINFALEHKIPAENGLFAAVELHDPKSNRTMRVATDLPGVQFYNAAKLGSQHFVGKGGVKYGDYAGMCFETQGFPDAPNHANFPSITLARGQTRTSRTVHRFSW